MFSLQFLWDFGQKVALQSSLNRSSSQHLQLNLQKFCPKIFVNQKLWSSSVFMQIHAPQRPLANKNTSPPVAFSYKPDVFCLKYLQKSLLWPKWSWEIGVTCQILKFIMWQQERDAWFQYLNFLSLIKKRLSLNPRLGSGLRCRPVMLLRCRQVWVSLFAALILIPDFDSRMCLLSHPVWHQCIHQLLMTFIRSVCSVCSVCSVNAE